MTKFQTKCVIFSQFWMENFWKNILFFNGLVVVVVDDDEVVVVVVVFSKQNKGSLDDKYVIFDINYKDMVSVGNITFRFSVFDRVTEWDEKRVLSALNNLPSKMGVPRESFRVNSALIY